IVDDHTLFADGLTQVLGNDFEVVGHSTDGRMLVDTIRRLQPEVVLLDVSLPQANGLDLLREIGTRKLPCRIIVLTMHADARMAAEALKAGAAGFLLKESSRQELLAALEAVLQGRTYLTSTLTREVLAIMSGPVEPEQVQLTTRQREVLRLIVQGQR